MMIQYRFLNYFLQHCGKRWRISYLRRRLLETIFSSAGRVVAFRTTTAIELCCAYRACWVFRTIIYITARL